MDNLKKITSQFSRLRKEAVQILYDNTWDGRYTVPSGNLYPYQWNWDSGFVAMGFARFDIKRAFQEFESLFDGQWENGMLPHIVFHSKKREGYFPGPKYWQSSTIERATKKVETSGITQPPVHAFMLERIYQMHPNNQEVKDFIISFFPKLMKLHKYYYQHRDPENEGLIYIYHPWASGRDNSPLWDDLVKTIPITKADIPPYKRYDNLKADPSERPSDRDYDIYVYLMELGKKHKYRGIEIAKESPFVVQDTLYNAVLIKSNEALINFGKEFGFDVTEIEELNALSKKSFDEKLWLDELGMYAPYDLRNKKHIKMKEIGSFVSLYAGIPNQERADQLIDYIDFLGEREDGYRIMPSFDPDHWIFDPKKYWKGPVWPQMNWLLYQGCKKYGHHGTANILKWDFLELVNNLGFHEYFDPRRAVADTLEKGYGGDRFSWTAAVVLDLMAD